MKKFLISILSKLGFGVNGVMPTTTKHYINNLAPYVKEFTLSVVSESDTTMRMEVKDGSDIAFDVCFTFTKDTRRITQVTIVD